MPTLIDPTTMTEQDEAQPEPTTPVHPEPVRATKKRLTLQERLALAAKSKKKGPNRVDSPIEAEFKAKPDESDAADEKEAEVSEPNAAPSDHADEIAKLKVEISLLKLRNAAIVDENKTLKASGNRAVDPQLTRLIAEKDATIEQLMEEGQALSVKELKLNEKVRTLAANNSKLEASLKSYSEKNEETLLKLGEIEDIMKVHKLKSVDQLLDLLSESAQNLADATALYEKEKELNWEGKYKELQRLYENELGEKKRFNKELSDARVQLQMLESQAALDVQSKDDLVAHLNQEIISLKDENSAEVERLESKIEGLRLENESFLKMSQNGKPAETLEDVEQKLIDYHEYAKLSDTHRNLQSQYVSSQENWKLIESNLLSKVDTLSSSLDTLKKGKLKATNEIRKLNTQISLKSQEIDSLKATALALAAEIKDLRFQLQVKANEYSELEEKLQELKTVFNTDRQNYDAKIKALNESAKRYEEQAHTFPSSVSVNDSYTSLHSRRLRDSGLHINLEMGARTPSRNLSYNSMMNSSFHTPGTGTDLRFEDLPTPGFNNSHVFEHNNNSSISFNEDLEERYEASDTVSADDSYYKEIPTNLGATKNIQLINKMSSNIRRLEVELMSLREENEQLAQEKDQAQQEIVNKSALNSEMDNLQRKVESLQLEIEDKSKREQTLLELIGEKSERVAELQADVLDLKDLCRQQVQQMIEMTGK